MYRFKIFMVVFNFGVSQVYTHTRHSISVKQCHIKYINVKRVPVPILFQC